MGYRTGHSIPVISARAKLALVCNSRGAGGRGAAHLTREQQADSCPHYCNYDSTTTSMFESEYKSGESSRNCPATLKAIGYNADLLKNDLRIRHSILC
jgi:hypothetical protein